MIVYAANTFYYVYTCVHVLLIGGWMAKPEPSYVAVHEQC